MVEVGSNSSFSISQKLGLEAGSRVIWSGSGLFGLDTQSSSLARLEKIGLVPPLIRTLGVEKSCILRKSGALKYGVKSIGEYET